MESENLEKNKNEKNNKIEHQCFRCKKICLNVYDLKRHLNIKKKCVSSDPNFSMNDDEVYKKSIHKIRNTKKITKVDELIVKRKQINLTCPFCDKLYPNMSRLTQHKKTCKKRKEKPYADTERNIKKINDIIHSNNNVNVANIFVPFVNPTSDNIKMKLEEKVEEESDEEYDLDKIIGFEEFYDKTNFNSDFKSSCCFSFNFPYILSGLIDNSCYMNVIPIDKNISYVYYKGNSIVSNNSVVYASYYKLLDFKKNILPYYRDLYKLPLDVVSVLELNITNFKNNLENDLLIDDEIKKKIMETYRQKFYSHDLMELRIRYGLLSNKYDYIDTHTKLLDYLKSISDKKIISKIELTDEDDDKIKKPYDSQIDCELVDNKIQISSLFDSATKRIEEENIEKRKAKIDLLVV